MSPFSKSYRPQIDAKALAKSSRDSERSTARRARLMASDDPYTAAVARSTLGPFSNASDPAKKGRIAKNSKIG